MYPEAPELGEIDFPTEPVGPDNVKSVTIQYKPDDTEPFKDLEINGKTVTVLRILLEQGLSVVMRSINNGKMNKVKVQKYSFDTAPSLPHPLGGLWCFTTLTPAENSPNLGVSHHLMVIRLNEQSILALPM